MITITKYTVAWNETIVKNEFSSFGQWIVSGFDTPEKAQEYWEGLDSWNKSNTSIFKVTGNIFITNRSIEEIEPNGRT